MTAANGPDDPIIIKKYANRRLYDTSTSAYVTLEYLSGLVRDGKEFTVQDAKTGADLTRAVLAQIIFEQENRKEGVLPVSFLRQLIQFYGDSFQSLLPAYLELSMQNFTTQQEKWRQYMERAFNDSEKAKAFDDTVRKNMEIFEETVRLFTPFPTPRFKADGTPDTDPETGAAAPPPQAPNPASLAAAFFPQPPQAAAAVDAIKALQNQMMDMQKQLAALAGAAVDPRNKS